jgi:uncharacterized protein YbjT (DUF2867 family)
MKCIIAGASGLVGSELLSLLLADNDYNNIQAIFRKNPDIQNPKIEIVLNSFKNLENAEVAFCCLGTTIKTAGSKDAFYKVDHDLVINFAKSCHENGVKTFVVVSALGADPKSNIFYNQVKGITESDLAQIGFSNLIILRPSLLLGDRKEFRLGEKIARSLSPILSLFLIGSLAKSKPIEAKKVAQKMLSESHTANGFKIILNHEI